MRAILLIIAVLAASASPAASGREVATQPAPSQSSSPVYSLISARMVWFHALSELDCFRVPPTMDRVCSVYSSIQLDHAHSLAGPPVSAEIYPATEVRPQADYDQPVLLIMLRDPAGEVDRVVAAAAADRGGRACIPGADLERLRWHPTGPMVQRAEDGGVCADLSPLQGLKSSAIAVVSDGDLLLASPSLIVGHRIGTGETNPPPCASDAACAVKPRDVRLTDVRTISGPRTPARLVASLRPDMPAPTSDEMVLVVTGPDQDRHWNAYWIRAVASDDDDACIASSMFGSRLREPRGSYVQGDQICFPI